MRTFPRTLPLVVIALLGAGLVAGCSASNGDRAAGTSSRSVPDDAGADSSSGLGDGASEGQGVALGGTPLDEHREIITTGDLTLVAADPKVAVQSVGVLVESAGGRVESSYEYAEDEDEDAYGGLTVRLPAGKVSATVEALDGVGEVQDVSIVAKDVTSTAIDLDARIQALGTSVARLETLMAESVTTADLLAAEKELTTRQAELESLRSQRTSITDQVDMSTLSIKILTQASPATIRPDGFLGGLSAGWGALLIALDALIIAFGAALPWLVLTALVAFVLRAVVRKVRGTGGSPRPGSEHGRSAGGEDDDGRGDRPDPGHQESPQLLGSGGRRG